MNQSSIAAALATLTGSSLAVACHRAPAATEVPASAPATTVDAAAEHVCGNHAEGACSSETPSETELKPEAPTARSFEVSPGQFAEANFTMAKGSTVTVTFARGSAEIAWDVHSHDHAGGTKIHDNGAGGDGTIEFTAPEDGVFSALWRNNGTSPTPLDVSVDLGEGARVHSWMPAD